MNMKTKTKLVILIASAIACSVLAGFAALDEGVCPVGESGKRPNMVFIIADDERWDMLSCSGNQYLKTPNRDRLASEGMRFTHAFTTSAVCSPSRGSFLTGKHVHQCGTQPIIHMNYTFHRSERPFPARLHDVGYHAAHFGKWHLGEGQEKKPGYDHWVGYYALIPFFNPVLTINGERKQFEGFSDFVLADLAADHIREVAKKEEPFCVYVAFVAPHYDFSYPDDLEHVLDDAQLEHPPSFYEDVTKSGKPKCVQNSPLRFESLVKNGVLPDPRSDTLEKLARRYMRSSLSLDESVGRVMKALDDAGVADDTIVVYTSDHGHMLGEHGLAAKHLAYEESVRVPMIVRYPRMVKPGSVRGDLVANIDVAPTLLDLAGAPIPEDIAGHSMRPLLEAGNESVDHWADDYAFLHETCVAVRTHQHKIIHYRNVNEWELYDLEKDPYEITNRYGNATYASVQKDMENRLEKHLRETDFPKPLIQNVTAPWLLGSFPEGDADEVVAAILAGKSAQANGKPCEWKQPSDPTRPINPAAVLGGKPDDMFLAAFDIEVLAERDPFVRLWFEPLDKALTGWVNGERLYNRHTNGSFWDHTFNPPLKPGRNRLLFLGRFEDYPTLGIRVHGHEGKTRILE